MNVLLVQPPGNYIIKNYNSIGLGIETGAKLAVPPLGLLYIAQYLRQNGHEVEVLDCQVEDFNHEESVRTFRGHQIIKYGLSDKDIKRKIERTNPDVVAVSVLQCTRLHEGHKVIHLVKSVDKNIITIMGGQYPTNLSQLALQDTNLDYCIVGEGEIAMLNLVNELQEEKSQTHTHSEHYGHTIRGAFLGNLDNQYPAWDLIDLKKYAKINFSPNRRTMNQNFAIMITSRGCVHNCEYCAARNTFGSKWRSRKPVDIFNEVAYLKEHGIEEIQFEDSDLLASKSRMFEICSMLKLADISWCSPHGMSVQKLDYELLDAMSESGCYALHLSVEFGSEKMLKQMKPTVDLNHTRNIVKYAKSIGLDVTIFTMIGHPDETREEVSKTIDFVLSLEPTSPYFFLIQPMPNTKFYDWCKTNNYIMDDFDYGNLRYSIQNLKNSNFVFDKNSGWSELEEIRHKTWQEYMGRKQSEYDFWR